MESNWRFNVWLHGQSQGRVRLIAHALDYDESRRVYAQVPLFGFNNVWAGTADEQGYVASFSLYRVHVGPGWPFGVEVQPD